jgi:hypothetical protein
MQLTLRARRGNQHDAGGWRGDHRSRERAADTHRSGDALKAVNIDVLLM